MSRPAAWLLALWAGAAPAGSVFEHPADAARLARDLEPAVRTLREARSVRGHYTQTRTLRELPKPLAARGTFLFARDHGIAWRTVEPFESELVVTGGEILQRDRGGTALRLSAEQQPGVRAVSAVFFAVFALDFAALESLFDLYSRATGSGWELGLRPKPGLAGAIREIVVSGATHVERVRMADAGGDETDLRFREVAVSPEPPGPDDLARFRP